MKKYIHSKGIQFFLLFSFFLPFFIFLQRYTKNVKKAKKWRGIFNSTPPKIKYYEKT